MGICVVPFNTIIHKFVQFSSRWRTLRKSRLLFFVLFFIFFLLLSVRPENEQRTRQQLK